MKRLKLLIIIFCLALAVPLAYVSWRTYAGLAQEELSQLNYFSEALFDTIEQGLADLIQKEENRSVEAYHHTLAQDGPSPRLSPLARMPSQPYIVGYFQNNPDGSFQTPLVEDPLRVPQDRRAVVALLKDINQRFNQKKFSIPASRPDEAPAPPMPITTAEKQKSQVGLADRYLAPPVRKTSKLYLGKKEVRTEEITVQQALNLAPDDLDRKMSSPKDALQAAPAASRAADVTEAEHLQETAPPRTAARPAETPASPPADETDAAQRFQVEVAPFQSIFITTEHVFIFRRIAIRNQIYRQGFVVNVAAFIDQLTANQFDNQPISGFARLSWRIMDTGPNPRLVQNDPPVENPRFSNQRRFPAPFDFLTVALQAETIPSSPARRPLTTALTILGAVLFLGLLAIYHSTRTVVDMSERRAQFVSSVTHELKTPLTNIRMYIEMIEQGIAATPEREQEYLQVLDAESARLSQLINNVLELAKLEKKQRRFHYREGDLEDVLAEVRLVMSQKLNQEGFDLVIDAHGVPVVTYDREVLVQLLVNLIENSIKFGRQSPRKRITIAVHTDAENILIGVSDTGPGIPRHALKKIFNDFYRVDNELTRTTGGTGIGLALVKKFVTAMGGTIQAANNAGAGCTFTMRLPRHD